MASQVVRLINVMLPTTIFGTWLNSLKRKKPIENERTMTSNG